MKNFIRRIALLLAFWMICINVKAQCPIANTCEEISADQTLFLELTDQDCEAFSTSFIASCLDSATPDPNLNACDANENPTVWLAIQAVDLAEYLVIAVDAQGSWTPTWSVYSGDCSSLSQLNAVAENGDLIDCGQGKSAFQINISGNEIQTYLVAVSGLGDIDDSDFTLSAYTIGDCFVCEGELGHCETSANFFVTDRSFDSFPLDTDGDGVAGPFFSGENVTVCLDYFYDASVTGADWLIGIVPTFGNGWDLDQSDLPSQSLGGSWEWYEAGGDCAPIIQEQMPNLCTYTDDDGKLQICNVLCEACPCSPPLMPQEPLPSGWFWVTNGGTAGCANDCSPGEGWGVGTNAINVSFCLELTVKDDLECEISNDLSFSFQTFSDGTAGCWDDPIGVCKIDNKQVGPEWKVDCSSFADCTEGTNFPTQFQCSCDEITEDLENLVICDLNILDGYTGTMSTIDTGNGPSPLCSEGGTPHNITWFAFVAGTGDFDIEFIPDNCNFAPGGVEGMQVGIYADCSFTEEIWCTPDCSTGILSTATGNIDWIPGKTYYLFFDGCNGSVCDFELNVICNNAACDPYSFESGIDILLQTCESNLVALDTELCLGETYELFTNAYSELNIPAKWTISNPIGQVEEFENVIGSLDYNFFQTGVYLIVLELNNGCAAIQTEINVNVAVSGPIQFEPISACEGELVTPEMIVDSTEFFWEQPIDVPAYVVGGDNVLSFSETFDGLCDCITQLNIDIEVLPNAVLNDTIYAAESDFPIDYNGFTIPGPVDPLTIFLEQAADNGCDSIINLTVFVSTDVLDIDNTEISIYPNPSNGLIHIEHKTNIQFERLEVIDIHGRSVKSMPFNETVDLSDALSGLYFLKLMNIQGQVYYHNVIID